MAQRWYPADREPGHAAHLIGSRRNQPQALGIDPPVARAQHQNGILAAEKDQRLDDLAHGHPERRRGQRRRAGGIAQAANLHLKSPLLEPADQARGGRVHRSDRYDPPTRLPSVRSSRASSSRKCRSRASFLNAAVSAIV